MHFVDDCEKLKLPDYHINVHYENENGDKFIRCWINDDGDKFLAFSANHYNWNWTHGASKCVFTIPYPPNFREIMINLLGERMANEDERICVS